MCKDAVQATGNRWKLFHTCLWHTHSTKRYAVKIPSMKPGVPTGKELVTVENGNGSIKSVYAVIDGTTVLGCLMTGTQVEPLTRLHFVAFWHLISGTNLLQSDNKVIQLNTEQPHMFI